jgi:hypothetical protein
MSSRMRLHTGEIELILDSRSGAYSEEKEEEEETSLSGPDILLSTLFSNTFSVCSSCNVRDQVSHHAKPQAKL